MSDAYPFDPRFEREIVALLVTSTRFWNRMGPHLDSERFKNKKAKLLAFESQAVYDKTGKPPGSLPVVLQRLQRRHEAGKLSLKMLEGCAEYVLDAEEAGVADPDVVIPLVADVVKRLEQQSNLDQAFTTYAERGDMAEIGKKFESIENIGVVDVSMGSDMESLGEDIDERGQVERLPTGFRELDSELDGGIARGEEWFYLAGDKVGKTQQLTQTAAIGLTRGLFVAGATLELDKNKWRARVMAAVTGTPTKEILRYGSKSVAIQRWKDLRDDPAVNLGLFAIEKFRGHQTPVSAMLEWVNRIQDKHKRKIDVLVCDYADKLVGKEKDSDYLQMRDVYELLRLYAEAEHIWVITASQAQRIALGEMPTKNHCADSQHKARVTDGMIGLTRHPDDDNSVSAKVLISRNDGDGYEAGPVPNGFEYGCFVQSTAGMGVIGIETALKNTSEDDLGIFA